MPAPSLHQFLSWSSLRLHPAEVSAEVSPTAQAPRRPFTKAWVACGTRQHSTLEDRLHVCRGAALALQPIPWDGAGLVHAGRICRGSEEAERGGGARRALRTRPWCGATRFALCGLLPFLQKVGQKAPRHELGMKGPSGLWAPLKNAYHLHELRAGGAQRPLGGLPFSKLSVLC